MSEEMIHSEVLKYNLIPVQKSVFEYPLPFSTTLPY